MQDHLSLLTKIILLSLATLVACGKATVISTALATPAVIIESSTPTAIPTSQVITPTPNISPTLEPTATPIVLPQFRQLFQLGQGNVEQIAVSLDGQWVATLGSFGVRLYDATTFQVMNSLDLDSFTANQIAFSPNSQRIAIASSQNTVKLWDVSKAQFVADLTLSEIQKIYRLAWSPDGTQLAISTRLPEEKILLVDVARSRVLLTLPAFSEDNIAWSPDGKRLAQFNDFSLRVVDLSQPDAEPLLIVVDRDMPIESATWSPDGEQIAAGSNSYDPLTATNFLLRVWSIPIGAQRAEVSLDLGSVDAITHLAWSPDGAQLAAGTEIGQIQVWDVRTGQRRGDLQGHVAEVTSLGWLPDSQKLISGSRDGTLRAWQVPTGKQIRSTGEDGAQPPLALKLRWAPSNYQLAIAGLDGTIQIWDTQAGQLLSTLNGHRGAVNDIAWAPNGSQLVSGGEDGTVRFWDVARATEYWQVSRETDGKRHPVLSVDWQNATDELVAVGYKNLGFTDGGVQVWNTKTQQIAWAHENLFDWGETVSKVRWSPNGQLLATTGASSNTVIFSFSGEETYRDETGRAEADDIVWSPVSKELLFSYSPSYANVLVVREIILSKLEEQTIDVSSFSDYFPLGIDWSHNGLWWLIGDGPNYNLQIWDVESRKPIQTLDGHTGLLFSVAWSYDDRFIASSSEDGTVRIWSQP